MDILKVGMTRIIPKETTFIYSVGSKFSLINCSEIRERLLKDGSIVIAGYSKTSNLANFIRKINKKGFVEQEKYYSSDVIGITNQKKETQLEKVTFNKIGDVLKYFQIFKTYENKNLVERFESLKDVLKGIDRSEQNLYKEEKTIKKSRINSNTYLEEIYYNNKLIKCTRKKEY